MSRVDRVAALQALLRSRESASARQLAEELGVSERTVLRDLSALRDQGIPVEAQSGPGGGFRLERDRGLLAVHLAPGEAISLWLAATLAGATSSPWSCAARGALDKLLSSLPRDRARALRSLARRVVVGAPASPRIYGELGQPRSEVLTVVERSFEVGACLELDYVDRREKESRRTVEPHGLLVETPAWYLLCRDRERQAVRMFRLDRIRMARLLPLTFQPDLEAVHREWLAQLKGSPSTVQGQNNR